MWCRKEYLNVLHNKILVEVLAFARMTTNFFKIEEILTFVRIGVHKLYFVKKYIYAKISTTQIPAKAGISPFLPRGLVILAKARTSDQFQTLLFYSARTSENNSGGSFFIQPENI